MLREYDVLGSGGASFEHTKDQETPDHPQLPDQTVKWTGYQRDLHGFSDYRMGRTCL